MLFFISQFHGVVDVLYVVVVLELVDELEDAFLLLGGEFLERYVGYPLETSGYDGEVLSKPPDTMVKPLSSRYFCMAPNDSNSPYI